MTQLLKALKGKDIGRSIRVTSIKMWKDDSKSKAASESIGRDSAKLWNTVPINTKSAPTLSSAKREKKILQNIRTVI